MELPVDQGYPTEWDVDEGKNIKWKTIIPREGKSSPVIWKTGSYITGAEAKTCEVYCLDKNNGDIIWTASASDLPGEPEELRKWTRMQDLPFQQQL